MPAPGQAHFSGPAEAVGGFFVILLHALAQIVHDAQGAQAVGAVPLGGFAIEQDGLFAVLLYAVSELIAQPQQVLRPG